MGMQPWKIPMTRFALLGAASLLSLTAATPSAAQAVIDGRGGRRIYCY
jgi:hypothetical protein